MGDKDVTMIERVIIDVDAAKVTRLKMPPDQHRSTLCDNLVCPAGWEDVQWADDGKTLAFVSTSRDHKTENVRIADVTTGAVRDVFTETVPTFFESGYEHVNWRYLSRRNEILWFSQRANWGNLYLYDAGTGKLKHAVTQGDWNVDEVLYVNQQTGEMILTGTGREPSVDPYYRRIYSANLDGTQPKLLTAEDADHVASRIRRREIHPGYLFHAAEAAGYGVARWFRTNDPGVGTRRYHAFGSRGMDRTGNLSRERT